MTSWLIRGLYAEFSDTLAVQVAISATIRAGRDVPTGLAGGVALSGELLPGRGRKRLSQ